MERKSKRGSVFLIVGVVLILVALGWSVLNFFEDNNAGKKAAVLLEKMDEVSFQNDIENTSVALINGETFCGKLSIEKLGVELPVYDEWSYERLKTAPCRYTGSIQENNIVIAAHNYKSHFGNLNQLQIDDEIIFIDAKGKKHCYSVKEISKLDGTAVNDMKSGEWDFTLFTCTKSGKQRVTVRCNRISESE